MKIIINSTLLATELSKFNPTQNPISRVEVLIFENGNSPLVIMSGNVGLHMPVTTVKKHAKSKKYKANPESWQNVLELINGISEQPIILRIKRKKVEVIFQY
jgi:hypothetical protein